MGKKCHDCVDWFTKAEGLSESINTEVTFFTHYLTKVVSKHDSLPLYFNSCTFSLVLFMAGFFPWPRKILPIHFEKTQFFYKIKYDSSRSCCSYFYKCSMIYWKHMKTFFVVFFWKIHEKQSDKSVQLGHHFERSP